MLNSETLFKWHAQGTVNYTNGFTVAVQKIDASHIQSIFSTLNVNGIAQTLATVRGSLHFRNLKIGYDVIANLRDSGTQRFTGLYMYSTLSIQYEVCINFLILFNFYCDIRYHSIPVEMPMHQ